MDATIYVWHGYPSLVKLMTRQLIAACHIEGCLDPVLVRNHLRPITNEEWAAGCMPSFNIAQNMDRECIYTAVITCTSWEGAPPHSDVTHGFWLWFIYEVLLSRE
jgi:hypothetical protein